MVAQSKEAAVVALAHRIEVFGTDSAQNDHHLSQERTCLGKTKLCIGRLLQVTCVGQICIEVAYPSVKEKCVVHHEPSNLPFSRQIRVSSKLA